MLWLYGPSIHSAALAAQPDDYTGLSSNPQALAAIIEKEMNTVLLSCTRARRQARADTRQTKPTVH